MMKKINICLLACLICILFVPLSATAQPISFDPTELYVIGKLGDLEIEEIEITNNENTSIEVKIEYVGETEVFIPNNVVQISANSERFIALGFILENDEIGWLRYTVGSTVISQLVIIKISKTTPSLMVFPEKPKAGSSIIFMITSGDILDAQGFIFCSETGNTYPIAISNGIGTIKLNENETGSAVARITGDGLNPSFVNFTILGSSTGNGDDGNGGTPNSDNVFSINSPDIVFFGERKDVTVMQGVNPASFESILINKPSGDSYESATNSFGKISVQFTEVGVWSFSIVSDDQIITEDTLCDKKNADLFLQTDNPLINSEVSVRVFDDAIIEVNKPDGSSMSGFEVGGVYTFIPDLAGSYVIEAENQESVGEITFTVKSTPKIIVTDIQGYPVGLSSKTGKEVYIRLVDSDNNLLEIDTVVTIQDSSNPYGIPMELELFDSVGTWTPLKAGSYTIEFSGSGFYNEMQTSFTVIKPIEGSAFNLWFILLAAIIVLVIVGLLLKKAPAEFWKKKYSNWRTFRKEKKRKKKERIGVQPPL